MGNIGSGTVYAKLKAMTGLHTVPVLSVSFYILFHFLSELGL